MTDTGPARRFELARSALMQAYKARDYNAGLRIALSAHERYPFRHVTTWYWQACMQSMRGDLDEAVGALRTGLGEGHWWSPSMLAEEGDFDPVREMPGFLEVRDECDRRFREKAAVARPECLLLTPSTATWSPQTLLVIHGYGDTAHELVEHWRALVDYGWALVVPQSSLPSDSDGFCWDDGERALTEIRQHLEDCRRKRGMDPDGMVIAGVSQGAPLAMQIALEAGLPWLCAIPWFPAHFDASPFVAVPTRTAGAFILGERDDANRSSRSVIGALEAGGVNVSVQTMKGVGHEISPDFGALAGSLLRLLKT
jgi:predicted esterase